MAVFFLLALCKINECHNIEYDRQQETKWRKKWEQKSGTLSQQNVSLSKEEAGRMSIAMVTISAGWLDMPCSCFLESLLTLQILIDTFTYCTDHTHF